MSQNKAEPAPVIDSGFAIDRDMVYVVPSQTTFAQAIIDRFRRQAGPMFDPAKPFLLGGSNEFAIHQQAGRGISVISVNTKDDHYRW